ncbi:HEAT repeat domain-containing protein [Euhalothece natronophila Z-M001]|uniref:HEAT repeat domain-containing protein n=1 Tax=Euhalothece natronophila Z-M001 TaxID=522448 RepID=A0A5B8NL43_9CHRO|nr:HEAT repeat domain-containing protein [Euhalothece natronophila]QDZ39982.1 HEAT repeat domain-containing protein [Euhalothece natronophila Z-M001]
MTAYNAETAIAHLNQTEDLSLRYYAAWWLGKFRITDSAAMTALLNALEDEADRSPDGGYPLRRNAARALGKLGNPQAVPSLIENLNCSDYYVREASAQALEEIGDSRAISPLLALLEGGVEAAKPMPGKPHLVQPYEAVIEALGSLGATIAIAQIQPFLDHPVEKVQFAAARALYQLTKEEKYGMRLVEGLKAEKLPLRRSALMDLGATDYLDAGSAIAQTPAENSLKLIALKGLLENHLQHQDQPLSPEAVQLLTLMDSLL